jgi:hypothetical protein
MVLPVDQHGLTGLRVEPYAGRLSRLVVIGWFGCRPPRKAAAARPAGGRQQGRKTALLHPDSTVVSKALTSASLSRRCLDGKPFEPRLVDRTGGQAPYQVHLLLRSQRDDVPEKALREWHHGAESGANDMPSLRTNLSKRGVVDEGHRQRVGHLPGEAI